MITVSGSESKQIDRNVMQDGRQIAIMHANIHPDKMLSLMVEILEPEAAKKDEDDVRHAICEFIHEATALGADEGLYTYRENG